MLTLLFYPFSLCDIHLSFFFALSLSASPLFHSSSNRAFVRVTDSLHVTGDPAGSVYSVFYVSVVIFLIRKGGINKDTHIGALVLCLAETSISLSVK